jgi:hypothetical protein
MKVQTKLHACICVRVRSQYIHDLRKPPPQLGVHLHGTSQISVYPPLVHLNGVSFIQLTCAFTSQIAQAAATAGCPSPHALLKLPLLAVSEYQGRYAVTICFLLSHLQIASRAKSPEQQAAPLPKPPLSAYLRDTHIQPALFCPVCRFHHTQYHAQATSTAS